MSNYQKRAGAAVHNTISSERKQKRARDFYHKKTIKAASLRWARRHGSIMIMHGTTTRGSGVADQFILINLLTQWNWFFYEAADITGSRLRSRVHAWRLHDRSQGINTKRRRCTRCTLLRSTLQHQDAILRPRRRGNGGGRRPGRPRRQNHQVHWKVRHRRHRPNSGQRQTGQQLLQLPHGEGTLHPRGNWTQRWLFLHFLTLFLLLQFLTEINFWSHHR